MTKEEKKAKYSEEHKFEKEYSEIFSILGINSDNVQHEWNKEGDSIREFNLYEDHPRPMITPNTHSLDC